MRCTSRSGRIWKRSLESSCGRRQIALYHDLVDYVVLCIMHVYTTPDSKEMLAAKLCLSATRDTFGGSRRLAMRVPECPS